MAVVDSRIVEMKFENKLFEKNVNTSISALERLKAALDFRNSTKSFDELEKSANKLDFSAIEKSLSSLNDKFSVFGVAGMTVISSLTNAALNLGSTLVNKVMSPITTGGWNRATNIDKAKFQLEGLDVEWQKIEKDINYGVSDTAYGLDAAAIAASQLVASGVEFGETFGETGNSPMAKALRGISGVAAMTNSSYEEISSIFTTVAGQGKLMTMQLRQLESRGLNAAANLGKVMGKTEEEIREMVTKGEIDFATFSEKMDEAFGEHAKEANKTFEGALANMKSALGRIGAEFAAPYREAMIPIFNKLREIFNDIKKVRLTPVFEDFKEFAANASNFVTIILGKVKANLSVFDNLAGTLHGIYTEFDKFMHRLFPYWWRTEEEIENVTDLAESAAVSIEDLANRVLAGEFGSGDDRRKALEELGACYELVQNKVNELLGNEFRYEVEAEEIAKSENKQSDALTQRWKKQTDYFKQQQNYYEHQAKWAKVNEHIADTTAGISSALNIFRKIAKSVASGSLEPLEKIGISLAESFTSITGAVGRSITALDKFLDETGFYESLSTFVNGVLTKISNVFENISAFIDNITKGENPLEHVFETISNAMDSQGAADFNNFLVELIGNMNDVVITLSGNAVDDAFLLIGKFFTGVARVAPKVIRAFPILLAISKIAGFLRDIGRTVSAFTKTLQTIPAILQAYANDINATALLKVAGAIFIVSAAFMLLSQVSWGGLAKGLLGLVGVVAALATIFAILMSVFPSTDATGFGFIKEKIEQVFQTLAAKENVNTILKLAAAIAILAGSMYLLSHISWDGILRGAVAIGILTGVILLLISALRKMPVMPIKNPIAAFAQSIQNIGNAVRNFLGAASTAMLLTALSITVAAIAGVITVLVRIDWEDGLRALTFMGIILAELLIFMNTLKAGDDRIGNLSNSVVMVAMASVIKQMGNAVKKLSGISWGAGLRGITFMGLILYEFYVALKSMTAIDGEFNSFKTITLMLAIGYVLDSLSSSVKKLSRINFLDGLKAIGFMGLLLTELYYSVQSMIGISGEGEVLKTMAFMVVISYVADSLADTTYKLSKIPFADGLKAVGLLGVLLYELITALNAVSTELKGSQGLGGLITMIGFAAAVKIMSGAIQTLADISAVGLIKAEAAIGGIMYVMTLLSKELVKISPKETLSSTLALIPIILAMITVVTAITALTDTDPAKLLAASTAITMVMASMVAFAGGMKILAKTKFTTILGAVLGFIAVMGAIGGLLYLMRDMDAKKTLKMSTAMSQMMAALGILAAGAGVFSTASGGFIGSLANSLGTGALLIVFTAVVTAIGYLNNKFPALEKGLNKSIPILQKVGEALGSLFGGFLSKALFEPLSQSFDGLGEGLKSFIDNIMPFINGTKDVPSDTSNLDNLKTLLTKIGDLGVQSFLAGIKSWFADQSGQELTFDSLNKFMDNFMPFIGKIKDVSFKSAIKKLGSIQTVLDTLAGINFATFKTWVTSWFAEGSDITSSVEKVEELVGIFSDLTTALDPVSTESNIVEKVGIIRDVVKKLGEVSWASWLASITDSWTGQDSMMTAMGNLVLFGEKLAYFSQTVGSVTEDQLTMAQKGLDIVAQLVGTAPGSEGWAQAFAGEKNLATFGNDLVTFGGDMEDFFKDVSAVDTTGADRIAWSILRLEHVFQKIMTEGGLSDTNFISDRLHNLSETVGSIFEDIAIDIGDEGAKVPLLEAGENMFGYLMEGFETAGQGYADGSKVGSSVDKIVEELLTALKGTESQEALDAEAIKLVEGVVSAMEISAQDSQQSLTDSITAMLKAAIEEGIKAVNKNFTDMDSAVRAKLDHIVTTIAGYESSITNAVATAFSGMEGKLNSYISSFETLGGNIMDGLVKGMNAKAASAASAAESAASGTLKAAKKAVNSNSPAKKFIELGGNMMEGLEIGVTRYNNLPINAVAKVAGNMVSKTGEKVSEFGTMSNEAMGDVMTTIMGAWAYITSMVDQDMDWHPVISPVLDLSNVQGGISGIDSILSSGYHFGASGIPDIYANHANTGNTGDAYNQEAILSQIRALRTDIATLGDAISKMQVTMSTGQVVGAVTPGIDRELGSIQKYNARWA